MIVADTGEQFQFVTQPAHARLAGRFADHWGGDVDRPEPRAATAIAAHRHDTGWVAYDRRPHLDDGGRPVDFREMPPGTWTDIYDDGVDAVAAIDAYAGLLVSMHGVGLRARRYGLSPNWPETPPAYEGFVDRHEDRQARLFEALDDGRVSAADRRVLSALHESGRPGTADGVDPADSRLWTNYRLLQAWDTLSLSFCLTASPPGYDRIDDVPTGVGESDVTLTTEPLDEDRFAVDPYPFDTDPLVVSVPVRTVPNDAFDDEHGLAGAYYRAGSERRSFTLERGE